MNFTNKKNKPMQVDINKSQKEKKVFLLENNFQSNTKSCVNTKINFYSMNDIHKQKY